MPNNLEHDLLKDLHSQFAINQNHHQTMMIQLLAGFSVLISLFIYATLYQEDYLTRTLHVCPYQLYSIPMLKGKFVVSRDLYLFFTIVFCVITTSCYYYIISIAYAFRRDQTINYKIRCFAGDVIKSQLGEYGKPTKKSQWFCFPLWAPEVYNVILFFLFLINFCVVIYASKNLDLPFRYVYIIIFLIIYYYLYFILYKNKYYAYIDKMIK